MVLSGEIKTVIRNIKTEEKSTMNDDELVNIISDKIIEGFKKKDDEQDVERIYVTIYFGFLLHRERKLGPWTSSKKAQKVGDLPRPYDDEDEDSQTLLLFFKIVPSFFKR